MTENAGRVSEEFKALADLAYCDYSDQMKRPECLGHEVKLKDGSFGQAELDGHIRAAQLYGRHQAFMQAVQSRSRIG